MTVGQRERKTQDLVIKLFREKLHYTYLGNWEERENNSNIEEEFLIKFLKKKYSDALIEKAIYQLKRASTDQTKSLYEINKTIYSMLRYGIQVKEKASENKKTVKLIDWDNPTKNDFYVVEEVTVKGEHEKRPDVVLYVNGIAVVVIELKRSTVSVSEGIRQNLDNQKSIFIKSFFGTNQIIMAGNDTEGLRYGVIGTPEKKYLKWKEKINIKNLLDKYLYAMCDKKRLLEIIHDFIVFDMGTKKICRHNQYFGVKAAQKHLKKREGGIIWHTQGSGKSLTMIWLAKWIRENIRGDVRVLIITDRDELDEQIETFFMGVDETIYRTKSGNDLIKKLNETTPWLICSLIHKFSKNRKANYDDYLNELLAKLPTNFKAKGDLYIFVDECHRTQSGKLHKKMKKILPKSVFVGFTGTPILKQDKRNSMKLFGRYIHIYKFDEAVKDGVVLDLQYKAKEIEQKIRSKQELNELFEAKTRNLSKSAKVRLKKKWKAMPKLLSSRSRLERIVGDIMFDMATKERLMNDRGNAILVAGRIYDACRYYEMFQKEGLKKCAIITSYTPSIKKIKGETVSEDEDTENIAKNEIYQKMLGKKDAETFEKEVKKAFVETPGQMKLLIVVNKLLTGFDAPPATYLYIDKSMKDHDLFQTICRVNRLDGEDKTYGYVIDYQDLFNSLKKAVKDYTSKSLDGYDKADVEGLLKDSIQTAKKNLIASLKNIREFCRPVKAPKDIPDYIKYFCGDSENPKDLDDTASRRVALYKLTSTLLRSFANIAIEMEEAGFSKDEIKEIKNDVQHYDDVKSEIRLGSGDYEDLKKHEPSMRHLIDTYIGAKESKIVATMEDLSLVDEIAMKGAAALGILPKKIRKRKEVVVEILGNNVHKLIEKKASTNPKFFQKISVLLNETIQKRKTNSISHTEFVKKVTELVKNIKNPSGFADYPKSIDSETKMAIYDNLDKNEEVALKIDKAIIKSKPDSWKGNPIKERIVELAIKKALKKLGIDDDTKVKLALSIAEKQEAY